MKEDERNGFNIREYVARFPETVQDVVIKEIFVGDILKKVFETREGKAVLISAVELIANSLGTILTLGAKEFDKNKEGIKQACLEIKLARQQMMMWAEALEKRDTHEEQAKKLIRR